MKKIAILILLFITSYTVAQKGDIIFGFQFKPIVPNKFVGEYEKRYDSLPSFFASTKQTVGYSFGMVFRKYFTDKVALETGINFTKRNFNLSFEVKDSNFLANNTVEFINYQIPIKGLFFIQLSDEIFMNASLGIHADFFPSYVGTSNVININNEFLFVGARIFWAQVGANANFGFDFRTRKKGTFYLGTTYNHPFRDIMRFNMAWRYGASTTIIQKPIRGNYLTIDLRYYFPVNKKDKINPN
ncbi:MAG TPA: hypothetical protein EYG85_01640 [Crocinitomix sp.]|nr:hypothetical protein [Crocinitomix sp.]